MDFEQLVPLEQMSAAAQWLNNTFGSVDQAILTFYHNAHEALGTPMDVVVQLFTKLGDGGIFLIIVALFLMLFKKSRKVGIGMLGGIIVGGIAGFVSYLIVNAVYDKLCKKGKFGQSLENADIRNLFKKKSA